MKLVIDIGGSSVKSAIFDKGKLSENRVVLAPNTWSEMCDVFLDIKSAYKSVYSSIQSINFSIPGVPNQETGRIDGASSLRYLHEVNFIEEVTSIFDKHIFFENDANCASLAEMNYGAGKDYQHILFLVIGTGIGGTVIYDRKIKNGAHDFAGEFGMMLVDGKNEWAKLGSAVQMARKLSNELGYEVTGEEVFQLAKTGNKRANEAVEELYHYLALGIYNLQYILDPEIIIIGGGISNHAELIPGIKQKLDNIMNYGQRSPLYPEIALCQFKNDANLIGAGMLS